MMRCNMSRLKTHGPLYNATANLAEAWPHVK